MFKLVVNISLSEPSNKITEQQMQTMETRAQRQKNDGNEDAASPDIDSYFLRRLVTSMTKAMKNAITNAKVPVSAVPKNITSSSAIDPYESK